MIIERKEVLKAIRTEKLKAGDFIHSVYLSDYSDGYNSNCKVCAVGGVLRQKGFEGKEISELGNKIMTMGDVTNRGNEFFELEDKNYLNALSVKFEKLASKYGTGKRTRTILARFVKRHFPKSFSVSL